MKRLHPTRPARALAAAAAVLFAGLLVGCLTQQQMIERRIAKKNAFFAALPPESQQRIRAGHLETGDGRDAIWIVYGKPDRTFIKVTAGTTNEVWSYIAQEPSSFDESHPVLHPMSPSLWRESLWAPPPPYGTYEYLRIELEGDRVRAIESEKP